MFYTYLWLREDGTPYYVGKGKEDRGFTSDSHNVKCPMKNVVKGYIYETDEKRIITQIFDSEKDAFLAEIFLISFYGRMDLGTGCLRNLTNGGEGVAGCVRTEAHRKKLSLSNKGRKPTPEALHKRSERLKGKSWTTARKEAEMSRERMTPTCHPERKHKANGLCKSCAYRKWALENRIGKTHG